MSCATDSVLYSLLLDAQIIRRHTASGEHPFDTARDGVAKPLLWATPPTVYSTPQRTQITQQDKALCLEISSAQVPTLM